MTGSRVVGEVFTSTLRDGATVQVRRLEPADIDASTPLPLSCPSRPPVLLRRLGHIAHANGIRHLVADVLTTNHLMFKVLDDPGLHPQHKSYDSGVVHLDIDLPELKPESD